MFNTIKYSLTALLCCAAIACGSDNQKSAPIGLRSLSNQEQVIERKAQTPQIPLSEKRTEDPKRADQKKQQAMGMMGIQCYWIQAQHTAMAFGYDSDWIELEDGTVLSIPYSERNIVSWWATGDLIHVLPGSGWWWSSELRLHNATTGEIVDANLSGGLGPIIGGPYSLYISAIDDYQGLVYLQDGSRLAVDSRDINRIRSWQPGDYIITGCNDDWLSCRSPNILVNVATIDYIRVRPL